jgi:hypothetical protein
MKNKWTWRSREAVQIFMIFWPIWRLFLLNHIKYEIGFYDAGEVSRDWMKLQQAVSQKIDTCRKEKAIYMLRISLEGLWGSVDIYDAFASDTSPILHVIFWLGKLAIEETIDNHKRTITFSPI